MSKDAKILIVEDEEHINRLLEMLLASAGYYKIRKAFDGESALEMIKQDKPDLILLDVMLPQMDGLEVCRIVKNDVSLASIQIIMLTAKKMEEDILRGFESGAVDYVTKPFNNKILLARINAHLQYSNQSSIKYYKNFSLDEKKLIAQIDNLDIKLTSFEFNLMKLFISSPGVVFTRSQLLSYLRGDAGFDVSERAIDVQILNLRRKLGAFGENIETVRGTGYKLKEAIDE